MQYCNKFLIINTKKVNFRINILMNLYEWYIYSYIKIKNSYYLLKDIDSTHGHIKHIYSYIINISNLS